MEEFLEENPAEIEPEEPATPQEPDIEPEEPARAAHMYATIMDMRVRFGEVALMQLAPPDPPDPGEAEGPCEPALLAALADASSLVDAYAGKRYATPLAPVPRLVVAWTCDIARWRLDRAKTDEGVRKAYEDALQGLEGMAANGLPSLAAGGAEPSARGSVEAAGPPRFFSMASLRSF